MEAISPKTVAAMTSDRSPRVNGDAKSCMSYLQLLWMFF
jgi:hypothetical protein